MRNISNLHQEFVENCRDIVAQQSHVTINEAALEAFARALPPSGGSSVPDWKEEISSEANKAEGYDFKRAFYEFAMITAQQCGFIYANEEGTARKWHKDGSGSRAMVEKMAEIRAAGALPYYDISEAEVDARIAPLLAGVPFAEKRLENFKEFASAENHQQMMDLLDSAFDGKKYTIDMSFIEQMTKIFPESFGADPFMKKVLLTPLIAAANAHHHGIEVDTSDLVPPTDYVLPQVLNADHIGILVFSPELTEKLQKRQALPEDSDEVAAMRAATVLVCERLIEVSGLSAQEVDGLLWLAGRKVQNARPHMMCYTMRF